MDAILLKASDIGNTFALNMRPDTHIFLEERLPEFLASLAVPYHPVPQPVCEAAQRRLHT